MARTAARVGPALGLLIDNRPGRQVMRHHVPLRSCAYDPTQPVKHFSQGVLTLGCLFTHQGQVGSHKGLFFIAYIAWVCFSLHTHSVPNGPGKWEHEHTVMFVHLLSPIIFQKFTTDSRLLPPHTPCSASQFQCCGLNWRHLARWPGLGAIGAPSGERLCCPTLTRLSNNRA